MDSNLDKAMYAAKIFSEHKHKNVECWFIEKTIFERIQVGESLLMYKGCSGHQTGITEHIKIVSGDNGKYHYNIDDAVLIAKSLEQLDILEIEVKDGNYQELNEKQLRQYVKSHQQDEDAF